MLSINVLRERQIYQDQLAEITALLLLALSIAHWLS
jgi:hypothetical protein